MQKPDLSYYYGRSVVKVDTRNAPNWSIQLDGGVRINNQDAELDAPPDSIKGNALLDSIADENETRLTFGVTRPLDNPLVILEFAMTTDAYTISDPTYKGDDVVTGNNKVENEEHLPADPSPERVASGPETP
jgi:hypothetical protein